MPVVGENHMGPGIDAEALLNGDPALGEPLYLVDTNPTAECLAQIIYQHAKEAGLPVVRVTLWETPSSYASYSDSST